MVEYEEHKARSETFAKYIFFISLSNASAIYLFIQDIMQVYMKWKEKLNVTVRRNYA